MIVVKKKLVVILSVLGGLLLLVGIGMWFIYSLKNDRRATLERMDEVVAEYRIFSGEIDSFNDMRNSLYTNVFENTYYDTMKDKDEEVKTTLTNYEAVVDNVEKSAKKLENLCGDIYFSNSSVNTKCKSFPSVYEQIIHAFLSDVNLYNSNIAKYNEYQTDSGSNEMLEEYKSSKKFIDYNNDNKYEGKEE